MIPNSRHLEIKETTKLNIVDPLIYMTIHFIKEMECVRTWGSPPTNPYVKSINHSDDPHADLQLARTPIGGNLLFILTTIKNIL